MSRVKGISNVESEVISAASAVCTYKNLGWLALTASENVAFKSVSMTSKPLSLLLSLQADARTKQKSDKASDNHGGLPFRQ